MNTASTTHVPKYELPDGPGYLYEKVADHIVARIAVGDLKTHDSLPGERDLCREYGVSLGSVRSATALLRELGFVFTLRSKGTYVAEGVRSTALLYRSAPAVRGTGP